MTFPFVNRKEEFKLLDKEYRQSNLIVIFGRRRIGKTRLVEQWGKGRKIGYSQAVESSAIIQLEQIYYDIGEHLPTEIVPATWSDFLDLLSMVKKKLIIALDEFPYLVNSTPSLPSLLQKWIDHKQPRNLTLLLLGSSQTMMHSLFLDASSPLFKRARRLIHVAPMSYKHFSEALKLDPMEKDTFIRYSLVGGVPKYWEYLDAELDIVKLVDSMFFENSAFFENEPTRLLKDENINGLTALSILEAIGRGASKPSEIAAKLGLNQTSISRPMRALTDSSLIQRQLPFGESLRTTKRILYRVSDPSLKFWFYVFSPHRSRWHLYSNEKKKLLIEEHAASVLEESYRDSFPDASRYWESKLEFDCVRHAGESGKKIVISEIKWRSLNKSEKTKLMDVIKKKYSSSKLMQKFDHATFEVLGFEDVMKNLK